MKKSIKIIDVDKVTILQGNDIDLEDDLAEEYDLKNLDLKPIPYSKRLR